MVALLLVSPTSLDSGNFTLSLVHGKDSVDDPKGNTSVMAQHDQKLDNDGKITAKLLFVTAADNPEKVCFFALLLVICLCPMPINLLVTRKPLLCFAKDPSSPSHLFCNVWLVPSSGEADISGLFPMPSMDSHHLACWCIAPLLFNGKRGWPQLMCLPCCLCH
jgi:hypothetical protein